MIVIYNPLAWYWRDGTGRIYSSAARGLVAAGCTAFTAWTAAGNAPTPWPRDATGAETDAALAAVLAPYGIGYPQPSA